MINKLIGLIGARPEEKEKVLLLLAKGFFMGIFLAGYTVTAQTLFINRIGADKLDTAFVLTGLLGVVVTWVYSKLQHNIHYSRLVIGNIILVILMVLGIRVLFWYFGSLDWLIYTLYILYGPINALIILGFWGVFLRLFNLRQSKRIIGGIDSGQLSASILTFFALPFINKFVGASDILVLTNGCLIISLSFLLIIVSKYDIDFTKIKTKEEKRSLKFKNLFKRKYIVLLSAFLIVSMIALKFIEFIYSNVLEERYINDEQSLFAFIGIANGTIMILSFMIQTFVNDKIIADYGVKVAVLVMPVILGILSLVAIFIATAFGFSIIESAGFAAYFIVIVGAYVFTTSLRDAMENPAFKLYFLPLEDNIRFDIQTKIEGVIGQVATLLAGGLMLLLSFINLDQAFFLMSLVFVVIVMVFVVNALHKSYTDVLHKKLSALKQSRQVIEEDLPVKSAVLSKEVVLSLLKSDLNTVTLNLDLVKKVEPAQYYDLLYYLLKNENVDVIMYILKVITEVKPLSSLPYLNDLIENSEHGQVKVMAENARSMIFHFKGIMDDGKLLDQMARSSNNYEREFVAHYLVNEESSKNDDLLHLLLRDPNNQVRKSAIIAAGNIKRQEFWPVLLELIQSNTFGSLAQKSLAIIGDPVINRLESVFYKSGQSLQTMRRVLKTYGRIGSEKAKEVLWNKMDYPDKQIQQEVLDNLSKVGIIINKERASRIKDIIKGDLVNILWNDLAIKSIQIDIDNQLHDALKEENNRTFDHIYTLLSMIYDSSSIETVKENIESQNPDNITFAIELLDVFLDDDLKEYLIPVLDDIPLDEKLAKLNIYDPFEKVTDADLCKNIINRDYNQISRWTKACALFNMAFLDDDHVISDDLVAQLFNPDPLLCETAAWVIYAHSPYDFEVLSKRIPENSRKYITKLIPEIDNHNINDIFKLRFGKARFLKKVELFSSLSTNVLNEVLEVCKEVYYPEGASLDLKGKYSVSDIILLFKGRLSLLNSKGEAIKFGHGDLIGGGIHVSGDDYFSVLEDDLVGLKIAYDDYLELLNNHKEVLEKVLILNNKQVTV
ncbi:hypothetical protein [Marinigracilibium pacificum]|uniref:Cyclic nucleotide-binding domain-containing protein n=1 Tax=Marinigracilibium pacificum TaxID=2729599 RepID=A0A848J1D3_9BACT|nr:hypothetical protein [Marinigracilibium pacificum]NMM49325.1 hypothetical protein [Marinigracilibium pacificum]